MDKEKAPSDGPAGRSLLGHAPTELPPPFDLRVRGLPLIPIASDEGAERRWRDAGFAAADLLLLERIGEGGTGTVYLARQEALHRDVAVKRPASGAPPELVEGLVAEAQIAGSLEHPNIVPVHALGRDVDGRPVLVMKRIEGVSWGDLIRDPAHPAWSREGVVDGDRLAAHLEILMQVAAALHFAHGRGIIHRDMKPDNVMVGASGEAYVIDWGSACRLGEERVVVGTPAYMAPEMLPGSGDAVDVRTDVCLLGATLHEVLTGSVPHDGAVAEAVMSARDGRSFAYPSDVPLELSTLARDAMSRDKAKRPATAAAFRQGIAVYLRHRDAIVLSRAAQAKLGGLSRDDSGSVDADAGHPLLECRFAFLDALRIWDGNDVARAGLAQCTSLLIARELREANVRVARTLLADLRDPDPALVASVEAVEAEVKAAAERAARRVRERDAAVSARPRAVVIGAVGAVGALLSVAVMRDDLRGGAAMPMGRVLQLDLVAATMIGLLLLAGRRRVFTNAYNRYLWGLLWVSILACTLKDVILLSRGVDSRTAGALASVIFGAVFLVGAMTHKHYGWVSATFFAAAVLSCAFPPATSASWIGAVTVACTVFVDKSLRFGRAADDRVSTPDGREKPRRWACLRWPRRG